MTGGGIFGGSSKQTTQSTSEPWEGAQPALQSAIGEAQKLYGQGVGSGVYTGSTVVPWSGQTQQAMGSIQNTANANMGGQGLSGQYQNLINNGGLTEDQRRMMGGYYDISTSGGYNDAMKSAQNNVQGVANSKYSVSPELQTVLDQTGAQVAGQVNLGASAAGRYGSGMHQGAVAKNVGEVTNNAILSDYQNFQGRRDAANQSLFGMGQNAFNNRQNALSSISGLAQQGISNLGTAYTGMNAPAQDLMSVGSMNEDLATRQMNDQLRIFNEQQNLPWENVSRLNAIASGAGSLGGTTRQTQPGQNPFMTALGYGASGLGLLGGF